MHERAREGLPVRGWFIFWGLVGVSAWVALVRGVLAWFGW